MTWVTSSSSTERRRHVRCVLTPTSPRANTRVHCQRLVSRNFRAIIVGNRQQSPLFYHSLHAFRVDRNANNVQHDRVGLFLPSSESSSIMVVKTAGTLSNEDPTTLRGERRARIIYVVVLSAYLVASTPRFYAAAIHRDGASPPAYGPLRNSLGVLKCVASTCARPPLHGRVGGSLR